MTPHLSLESLESRETPAIVFVGGWGSSMYQSSTGASDAAPRWKIDFTIHREYEQAADQSQTVTGRITAVAVDPSDSFYGTGVYKSTDSGRTW